MKLIAHRGLIDGPNAEAENNPNQIEHAIKLGYECEVDIWMKDNQLFLGHDNPQYKIPKSFLFTNKLWIHAKNFEALHFLSLKEYDYNFFWHENDAFCMTSFGYIWTYPKKQLDTLSVCVMPELFMDLKDVKKLNCYGVCSDFVNQINLYKDQR